MLMMFTMILYMILFAPDKADHAVPDPDSPLPLSNMPMASYTKAAVVSNGGPCAQIGVDVLSRGGNAVDAAVATMICDGALCPEYMGLGGGFLMSVYNATTKKTMSIDARETAPAAANAFMYYKEPSNSRVGEMAIAVPGELKGYSTAYELYGGKVSWKSLFEPTIKLCEKGIQVSNRLAINLKNHEELIKNNTMLREILFDNKTGHVKKSGDTYKLMKLAETMKIISKEGANAMYNGSLTSKLLEDVTKVNGIITAKDFSNYRVEVSECFSVHLKSGHKIHAGPPPGSGIILAYILRVLDGILPASDVALDAHRFVEAFKFGFGQRTHLGDHNFVNVSHIYDKVMSDGYISSIQNKISDRFTSLDPKHYGADFYLPSQDHGTANVVVTDSKGNTVVATSTINTYFGSGIMSPSTGIIFNNEMDDFSTPGTANYYGIPSSPANFIAPGKRPMSSMCPVVITDENDNFVLGTGAAGGSKITLATAYLSALILWFNKTLKEAIDRPRIYHQLVPMEIQYEYGLTKDVVQKLKAIGHPIKRLKNSIGSAATAILKTSSGNLEAMADFRRPGNTSGY